MAIDMIENSELSALSESRLGSKCFTDDIVFGFGDRNRKKLDMISCGEFESRERLRVGNGFIDDEFSNFLGIGEGRQKAKKAARAISVDMPDEEFKNAINDLYNKSYADKGHQGVAKSNLSKVSIWVIKDAVRRYGVPSTPDSLAMHNAAVGNINMFPFSNKMGCDELEKMLSAVQNQIEANVKSVASGVNQRVADRGNKVLNDISKDIKDLLISKDCAKVKEQQEQEAAKAETLAYLEKVSGETSTGGKMSSEDTNKYIIYGVGGIVAVAALIILFK